MSTDSKQKSRRSHFGLKFVGSKERLRGGDLDERRVGPPSTASQEGLGFDIPLASPTLTAFSHDETELAGLSEEPMRLRTTLLEVHGPNVSGPNSPVHGSSAQSSPGLGGIFVPNRRSSLQKTSNSRSQSKRRSYHSGLRDPIALDDGSSSSRIKRESIVESKRQSLVEGDESESEIHVRPGRDRMTTEMRDESEEKTREVNTRGQALAESISASPAVASARAAAAAASAGASVTGSAKINGGSRPGPREAPKSDEESPSTQPSLIRRGNSDGPSTPVTKVTIHPVSGVQRPGTAGRIQDSTSRPGSSKGSMDLQQGSQTMPTNTRRNSRLNKRRIEPLLLGINSGHTPTRATASHTLARNSESNTRPATFAVDDKLAHIGRPSSADSIDNEIDVYLRSARLSQKIPHPQTRRIISFSEVGDPEGFAVFCCVGMGLTRYITAFYDELARSLKLRLITPDRPGVGESEAYADGSDTPLGWPGTSCSKKHVNLTAFILTMLPINQTTSTPFVKHFKSANSRSSPTPLVRSTLLPPLSACLNIFEAGSTSSLPGSRPRKCLSSARRRPLLQLVPFPPHSVSYVLFPPQFSKLLIPPSSPRHPPRSPLLYQSRLDAPNVARTLH